MPEFSVDIEWCKKCEFNPDNTSWGLACQLRFGENGDISFLEANSDKSCKKFREATFLPPPPGPGPEQKHVWQG